MDYSGSRNSSSGLLFTISNDGSAIKPDYNDDNLLYTPHHEIKKRWESFVWRNFIYMVDPSDFSVYRIKESSKRFNLSIILFI